MQDRRHDGQVRHLGVVGVGAVELVGLPDAQVDGVGLPVILLFGVVGSPVVRYEICQEGIRARGVVGRIRHAQDVLVLAVREVGPLPQLGQLLPEELQEVLPASVLRFEGHPQAGDRPRAVLRRRLADE